MKINYKTNYSGYIPILRAILFLIKNKTLTFAQLGAYIFFVTQADFDNRHKNYGVILREDKELAKEFGYNSSALYRSRKQLIKKGLLIEENGITKVANYYVFEISWVRTFAKLSVELLQSIFVKTQEEIAKNPFFIEKMQQKQAQNSTQNSIVSSKGDVGFSDEDIQFINENIGDNNE